MNKNYLLTYQRTRKVNGSDFVETTFAWFDTEEEMDELIERENIQIIEMFKINDIEDLTE